MNRAFDQDAVPPDLAALYSHVGQTPATGSVPSEGLDDLHAMFEAEGPLDRICSVSTPMRWVIGLAVVVALAGLVFATTRRPDFAVYPRGRMVLDLSLLLGPLLLALTASLRPLSRPALSVGRRIQAIILGVVGVGVLVILPAAHALHPASVAGSGAVFWKQAGACFGFGLAFAAVAVFGVGLLSRNGAQRWLPGSLGVWAAGLTGLVALYLHCPITHVEHLWAGHSTILVPLLALAWLLRGRIDG